MLNEIRCRMSVQEEAEEWAHHEECARREGIARDLTAEDVFALHDAQDEALMKVVEAVARVDWDAVIEWMRPTTTAAERAEVRAVRDALSALMKETDDV